MLAVQPGGHYGAKEELGAVRVGAGVRLAGVPQRVSRQDGGVTTTHKAHARVSKGREANKSFSSTRRS